VLNGRDFITARLKLRSGHWVTMEIIRAQASNFLLKSAGSRVFSSCVTTSFLHCVMIRKIEEARARQLWSSERGDDEIRRVVGLD
jgi:hypothetical protein